MRQYNVKSRHESIVHVLIVHGNNRQPYGRAPIECAPEASCGGREWAEMTEGINLEAARHISDDMFDVSMLRAIGRQVIIASNIYHGK